MKDPWTPDPWSDPEVQRWRRHCETELAEKMDNSNVVISIAPPKGKPDAKYAVELGFCIMLNKPILVVAETNDDIPPKLRAVADKILIGDWQQSNFQERLVKVMKEMEDEWPLSADGAED